ncbi:MAG: diacylglycerol/lipid kinase family protein [Phycisphaerae bacterium]
MRYVIIANPVAGRGRAERLAEAVHQRLTDTGAESRIEHTSARGEAETIAAAALAQPRQPGGDRLCVVACGGDGTIQQVANALMQAPESRGVLGLAPGGRCNDFASSFGVETDPVAIADVLLAGHLQAVDLGRVDDRYFCTVAAMGFDAAVSRFVNEMRLPLSGTAAYVYGVLRVLLRYRTVEATLSFGKSERTGPLFLAASANTPSYGGRMRIAPDANPHDGHLNVCVVAPLSRLRVLRLLRRVMRGAHQDLPEVRFVRTPSMRIHTAQPQEIWADGEVIGRTPAVIQTIPAALNLLVPARPNTP